MKCTKQSVIGVHPCSFTGNEIYKTKCHRVHFSLFIHRKWNVQNQANVVCIYKEKHVGKKHYLFLHKDFDWSKKLSQFTFNGQNFFLANTLVFSFDSIKHRRFSACTPVSSSLSTVAVFCDQTWVIRWLAEGPLESIRLAQVQLRPSQFVMC
jgi:hypothetical protein